MAQPKKAIILGDYATSKYHPLTGVDKEIVAIFDGALEVEATDDYSILASSELASHSLVISYTDCWGAELPVEQRSGLVTYVNEGGGLLVIHNGLSFQTNRELTALVGATFTGHPPYTQLEFEVTAPDHPVVEGIEPFSLDEEPYYFTPFYYDTTLLLQYDHDGQKRAAGWAHEYGRGRVVYLMPGHHLPSFSHQTVRRLIRQGGLWAARD
ncbi:ThuA domain-containing protein [Paenibacillus sp. GCM10012307]|uniref:ThuA domain-containing protein n=1 Tax=Paenibacillus roseus TaxID=2798579 RepID=A0A934J5D9_9BACL|nr:ThuA domain-containing protein [Paenibacillus roseus]MBJ6360643.1 ThuA domain-containing protein [Paenibacillus roseus]